MSAARRTERRLVAGTPRRRSAGGRPSFRVGLLAAVLLLLAAPAQAQQSISTTTCPGTGCAVFDVTNAGTAGVQVLGSFSGTIVVDQSQDLGATYSATELTLYPYGSVAGVTSTTATGNWTAAVVGLTTIRVRFSAYTSGTAQIFVAKSISGTTLPGGVTTTIVATGDPCLNPNVAKSSVAVTATGQLVALSTGKIVYGCQFVATLTGTTPTITFQYGTGSNCGTGTTALSGALAPSPNGTPLVVGTGGTFAATIASNAFCISIGGTGSPTVAGLFTYVQQ